LDHKILVHQNLEQLDHPWQPPMLYSQSDFERLRFKFPGAETIEKNFSQCYQDLFVLSMLNGKKGGSFLEIGHGDPWYGNNTALLEKWGWKGVSIDIDPALSKTFEKERKGKIVCGDATKLDIDKLLPAGEVIDYLQIDCDPAQTSLLALYNIPFHKRQFRVITFEHDHYFEDSHTVRDRSRAYLRSLGYVLVVDDVSVNDFDSFEDWWAHPQLLDDKGLDLAKHFRFYNNDPNRIDKIMFNLNF
jgi:hypothetical protein